MNFQHEPHVFVCVSKGAQTLKECTSVLPTPLLLLLRPLPTPPPKNFLPLALPNKAAQQPTRGASALIRVTNWGLVRAETPPHLHGHVTFKEVRRVKGHRGVGGVD